MTQPAKPKPKWPIAPQYRESIIHRQIRDAINPDSSASDANRAARLLLSMEKQNHDVAQTSSDAEDEQWQRVLSDAAQQRQSNLANDDLLDNHRLRALWNDMQPRPFRPHGEPRSLEDGSSPESN